MGQTSDEPNEQLVQALLSGVSARSQKPFVSVLQWTLLTFPSKLIRSLNLHPKLVSQSSEVLVYPGLGPNNPLLALQTQNPFPTVGTPGFVSAELGNPATPLSGRPIPFEFTYNVRTVPAVSMMTPAVKAGYTWKLSNLPSSSESVTQEFSPADLGIGGTAFSDPHNAILIGLSARFGSSGSSSAVLTDAKFEITESLDPFILCGSTDIPTTRVATTNGVADPIDQKSLWIVADRDLSRTSWKITGTITLTSTRASGGGEEQVKFFIIVKETGPVTAKDIVERCPETCGEPMVKRVPADMDTVSSEPICFVWVCVWGAGCSKWTPLNGSL
jgi:hypothetical protein